MKFRIKSKVIFYIILILYFIGSFHYNTCLLYAQEPEKKYDIVVVDDQMDFLPSSKTEYSDTMFVRFNLIDNKDTEYEERVLLLHETDSIEIDVKEYIGSNEEKRIPEYIPGSLKKLRTTENLSLNIREDITISLLIDRSGSINQSDIDKIKSAVKEFAEKIPEGRLFYSWFNDDISESYPVTLSNFDELDFSKSNKNTSLNNAIYTKLLEFDSTSKIPNVNYEENYKRNPKLTKGTRGNNYLIVLTDGKNDIIEIEKYRKDDFIAITEPQLISKIEEEKFKKNVDIFAIGFGDDNKAYDKEFLEMICRASGNPNGYFHSEKDSISAIFDQLGGKIAEEKYDYLIALRHPPGKRFYGQHRKITLHITSKQNSISAIGSFSYIKGDSKRPHRVGPGQPLYEILLLGLLTGIVVLLLVMIIIQLIIPMINNRIFIFQYVKKYKHAENELSKECQYCGDPLNPGEKVVVKCKHIVHHLCWKDFDHMCPEYGQNCNDGKEAYFDISDPFSRKNKIYYLSWVLFGLIGGFLSWLIFVVLKDWDFVYRIAEGLHKLIRPGEINDDYLLAFKDKIAPFLLVGALMGFFLSSFFMYVEEYRNKDLFVYGKIALRGVIGGLVGFISILIGCAILILINRPASGFLFDWIPWILFGMSIGYILSIRTTIVWKHGIIGGIISIIFCFIMIYVFAGELIEYATLVGFMIYGAGLGISIATVRSQSEHFFLKILQGKKSQGIIPVHKWMSYQGGHNEVYLGRGFACEIQLNWEQNNEEVAQKHAKMYINSRGMPVLVSLEKGKTTHFNNRFDMNTGKEYELFNGVKFQIGETVFQYIEKD